MSFCQRNPPTGFPVGRVSAPGVSRVPPKGQVWRGFRGILISAWRVWLRSFRTVPARWPDTRISKGENEQIVNAHPEVSFCQYRRCVGFASCTLRRIFESASPQGLRCVQSRLMQSAVYFFRIENPDMLHGITNSTRRESHAAAPGAENASISAPRLLGFFCSAGRCTACLPIARGRQSLTGAGRFPACGFQWAA